VRCLRRFAAWGSRMNVLSMAPRICGLTNDLALIASSIASDNSENPEFYGANSR
jgi:hypothetical protein